jgi:hypothetical protein
LAALLLAAPARADTTIAQVLRPTPIVAGAGTLLWSTYNSATGTYALTARRNPGEGISTVPIAPRSVPFDASLWVQEGEFAALYSRCAVEPKPNFQGLPRWATGRGCDIYAYDFNTGKETKVSAVDTKGASEFLPAVWPGAIAFFRVYERRKGVRGALPYLYAVGNLDLFGPPPAPGEGSTTRPKRLPVGTTRLCSTVGKPKRRECHKARDVTANSLAFRGSSAFVWEYQGFGEGPTYELRLDPFSFTPGWRTRRVRSVLLERGGTGLSADIFLSPTLARDGWLYYAETCGGDPSPCGRRERYHRYRLATGGRQEAWAPSSLLSFAHDPFARRNGESFYVRAPAGLFTTPGNACVGDPDLPGQKCRIVQVSPIRFR